MAGRVRRKHALGDKLFFYDLVQGACSVCGLALVACPCVNCLLCLLSLAGTSQVQVLVNLVDYKPSADQLDFARINDTLRRGDIIGVVGHPGTSNTGELSILAVSCTSHAYARNPRSLLRTAHARRRRWCCCPPACTCCRHATASRIRSTVTVIAGSISSSTRACAPRSTLAPRSSRSCARCVWRLDISTLSTFALVYMLLLLWVYCSFWTRAASSRSRRP